MTQGEGVIFTGTNRDQARTKAGRQNDTALISTAPAQSRVPNWAGPPRSSYHSTGFMELVQDWLDANDQSGEVRQQCIEQHKKDAEAKANAKSAKHAAAMAAMAPD